MDTTRASKGGHEFHELWAARTCLGLIEANTDFEAVAIEGLSSEEPADTDAAAAEIADVVLYYGGVTFSETEREEMLQLKHSSAYAGTPITASFLTKTITKFATHNATRTSQFGADSVRTKIAFGFITNRPAADSLIAALLLLQKGEVSADRHVEGQRIDLKKAADHAGCKTEEFFSRFELHAGTSGLFAQKLALRRTVATWSGFNDLYGRLRLHDVRQLVRDKAGPEGEKNNLIRRTDVLDALGVDMDDLLPTPSVFERVEHFVARPEIQLVHAAVLDKAPLVLVQGNAGDGKTIFAQHIAEAFGREYETVAFDCFAGGNYRHSLQQRHPATRGLVHIANTLAMRGLCDPLVAGGETDDGRIVRATLKRFEAVIETLHAAGSKKGLLVIIDAADNASMAAEEANENAFPNLLVDALHHEPIDGVTIIATSRHNRTDRISHQDTAIKVELTGFSEQQVEELIRAQLADPSRAEIARAYSRSRGNGRVLKYLVQRWETEIKKNISDNATSVEELIQAQISSSKKDLLKQHSQEEVDLFLAALSRLSPPVPVGEIASLLGVEETAIRSFITDFHPLIEESPLGVVFPDEPTETELRSIVLTEKSIARLKLELSSAQTSSHYAATTLPEFLRLTGDLEGAWELALSSRFPEDSSDQGRRTIQIARLLTALSLATDQADADKQVILTAELGTLTNASDQGDRYLSKAPELTCLLGKKDSVERLFIWRGGWRGARHARKAVLHALWGDLTSARSETAQVRDWLQWYFDKDEEERVNQPSPGPLDIASIPLVQILDGRVDDALANLGRCRPDRFRREVSDALISLLALVQSRSDRPVIEEVTRASLALGSEGAAIVQAIIASGSIHSTDIEVSAVQQLSLWMSGYKTDVGTDGYATASNADLSVPIQCTARALILDLSPATKRLAHSMQIRRPNHHEFTSEHNFSSAAAFVVETSVQRWAQGAEVQLKHLLPEGLYGRSGAARVSNPTDLACFLSKVTGAGPNNRRQPLKRSPRVSLSQADCEALSKRLWQAYLAVRAVGPSFLRSKAGEIRPCEDILAAWAQTGDDINRQYLYNSDKRWRHKLFETFAKLKLDASDDYTINEVGSYRQHAGAASANVALHCLGLLTRRTGFSAAAGLLAAEVAPLVERDTDIDARADGYHKLCRYLARVSEADAKVYFERGLRYAETLGIGDYDILFGILNIAAVQTGGDIPTHLSCRLMNLVQANFEYDSRKLPWGLMSKAASRSIGYHAFAAMAWWNDIDFASYADSLSQLACRFVEQGRLSAERAAALQLLAEPTGWHDWSLGDALKVILTHCEPQNREALARSIVERARRDNQKGGHPSLWQSLIETLGGLDETKSIVVEFDLIPLLASSEQRQRLRNQETSGISDTENLQWEAEREQDQALAHADMRRIAGDGDLTDEGVLAASWEAFSNGARARFRGTKIFFSVLRENVSFGDRQRHLEALAKLSTVELTWRLDAILIAIEEWEASSASIASNREALANLVVETNAIDLVKSDFSFSRAWHLLTSIAATPKHRLAQRLLNRVMRARLDLPGSTWLELCRLLIPQAAPERGQEALVRLLRHPAVEFAEEIGLGLPAPTYQPPTSEGDVVQWVIWHLLGETSTFARWRAARSIHQLAQLGLTDDLHGLAALLADPIRSPLSAVELKFSWQNAKQWLLLGVSRAVQDDPRSMRAFVPALRRIVLNDDDHALNKKISARGLLSMLEAGESGPEIDRKVLISCWKAPMGPASYDSLGRLDFEPGEEQSFSFEYEFNKHEIRSLSHIFGLSEAEARVLITREITQWEPGVEGYYDLPRYGMPRHPEFRNDDSLYEPYPAQLCRHALIQAGTKLSKVRPCGTYRRETDDADPWADWIARYDITRDDGLWLADATDLPPPDTLVDASLSQNGRSALVDDEAIPALLGIGKSLDEVARLPIYGFWNTVDDVSIRIESALLKRWGSVKNGRAFGKLDRHDRWLPTHDTDDFPCHGSPSKADQVRSAFEPWVFVDDRYSQIDQYDRYGSRSTNRRPKLTAALDHEFGITCDDDFSRTWRARSGENALVSEAWGGYLSEGAVSHDQAAYRLTVNPNWLRGVLLARDQSLFVRISLSKYISKARWSDDADQHLKGEARLLISPTGEIRRL